MILFQDEAEENVSNENVQRGVSEQVGRTPSRWRKRRAPEYARNKRKMKRNKGEEYYSKTAKKTIKTRGIGPSCGCSKQCRTKLDKQEETICESL